MAERYRELVVWQLADALRRCVITLTARGPAARDPDYVRDIRRSARSVAANIAEGFVRFEPGDFHRFLQIAKASLAETEDHLGHGLEAGYFSSPDHAAAQTIVRRLTVAMTRFMTYLRSPAAKRNARQRG